MSRPPFLDLPAPAGARRIATGRGVFAAHEALPPGPAAGTAVLVPGFTGSKEDFIALLEPLALAGYRVVAVDLRGQYETGGPRERAVYARDELARDVAALTDAVADGGPVHLVGHSFGGLVARAAVLAEGAGRWASLTLVSSGPGAIEAGEAARVKMLVDALGSVDLETIWRVKQELEEPKQTPPPRAAEDPAIEEFLHRRWLATVPEHLIVTGEQLVNEPDRVAELAAVPLPKLVLSGARDYAWPVPSMDAMARRLGADRVVVEGAGHSPNAEFPERTAAALVAFWDGVRSGGG
ncbi:alpha/beta hydrolase [Streptomyces capparidis]